MNPLLIAVVVVVLTVLVISKLKAAATGRRRVALDSDKWQPFRLLEKTKVSHDSYIFRFALHSPDQTLGLPIGSHIALRALCDVKRNVDGTVVTKQEMIQHTYTPISSDDEKGYVDFMIKVYFANTNPKFPFGGRLSQHLCNMQIGQTLEMMGPKGHFEYLGHGSFRTGSNKQPQHTDAFTMVAGGTGITPLLQVMRAIHKHSEDKTKVFFVFCNRTEDDILLRKEIDAVVAERPGQFHVWYTLSQTAPAGWRYSTGHIDESMLRKHVPVPNDLNCNIDNTNNEEAGGLRSVHALLCGPGGMLSQAVKPNLLKLGYTPDAMFTF